MGTLFGKDTRLSFGDDGSPEVFATLGGEKTFDWTRASTDIDTTDKDGPSGLYVPGRVNFVGGGNVKLPDVGMSAVIAAAKNGTPITLKIMAGAVVKYQGKVTIGNFKATFDSLSAVPYSFDMTAYATPTVDALDATA